MMRAQDVELRVAGRLLLEHVSFDLNPGELIAVLGSNGVGKTTLLRTLAGFRSPSRGWVLLDSVCVTVLAAAQRARRIAYVGGDDLFIDRLTAFDVVAMGRHAHHPWWHWTHDAGDDHAIDHALRTVGMHAFAQRRFDTLSSGERQRIWIALALAQQTGVLLLDEPTSHLDVRVAHEILALLREQTRTGKAILCVLHDVNEAARFADRILLLGNGRALALGSPSDVLTPALLYAAYGMAMQALRTPDGALYVAAALERYQSSRASGSPGACKSDELTHP